MVRLVKLLVSGNDGGQQESLQLSSEGRPYGL